jgi:hypothetical protein
MRRMGEIHTTVYMRCMDEIHTTVSTAIYGCTISTLTTVSTAVAMASADASAGVNAQLCSTKGVSTAAIPSGVMYGVSGECRHTFVRGEGDVW